VSITTSSSATFGIVMWRVFMLWMSPIANRTWTPATVAILVALEPLPLFMFEKCMAISFLFAQGMVGA
jgi:hypothetical protein